MPETLETIAAKIDALIKSNDDRFSSVDRQFAKVDERLTNHDRQFVAIDRRFTKVDQQFAETQAHLGVKIEAVDEKVTKIYDVLIAMRGEAKRNAAEHKTFRKRPDSHDIRILALDNPQPRKP